MMQGIRQFKVVAHFAFLGTSQSFPNVDICQKGSADQKKRCGQSDHRDPFPVGVFLDKRLAMFIFGFSSFTLSPVAELRIRWIPVPGIYEFPPVFAASTLSEGAFHAGLACHVINSPLPISMSGTPSLDLPTHGQEDFASTVPQSETR